MENLIGPAVIEIYVYKHTDRLIAQNFGYLYWFIVCWFQTFQQIIYRLLSYPLRSLTFNQWFFILIFNFLQKYNLDIFKESEKSFDKWMKKIPQSDGFPFVDYHCYDPDNSDLNIFSLQNPSVGQENPENWKYFWEWFYKKC